MISTLERIPAIAAFAYTHLEQSVTNLATQRGESDSNLVWLAFGIGILLVVGTPALCTYLIYKDLHKFREPQDSNLGEEVIEPSPRKNYYRHLSGRRLDENGNPVATSTPTRLLPNNVSPEYVVPPAETTPKYAPTIPKDRDYS